MSSKTIRKVILAIVLTRYIPKTKKTQTEGTFIASHNIYDGDTHTG